MNPPTEGDLPPPEEKEPVESRAPRKLGDLHKTITMAQIAKAAGVSQGAISSLLNDRDYGIRVSEKTRERVFKVCREMGYIPNDLRAVVRMYPELGEFCLLFSESISAGLSDPVISRIACAAMAAGSDPSHPFTFALYQDGIDYGLQTDQLPYPLRSGVASKFLVYGRPNPSLCLALNRRGYPVVSLGADIAQAGVVSLVPDYSSASRTAVEHLFALGHRHIGIVSGPFGNNDAQIIDLHRGIKEAHDAAGAAIEAQNIIYGDLTHASGAAALGELLTHPQKPTAIFCLSDAAAAGALTQAHLSGLHVPEDLTILGCGDDLAAELTLPPLTTVHVPIEEMAREGVTEIERLVRDGVPAEPRRRVLPVRLVERGSSAAPTAGK